MKKGKGSLTVETPGVVFCSKNGCIAGSPVLDVYSQGETKQEAVTMAKDAIVTTLEHLIEHGLLEKELKERGMLVSQSEDGGVRWSTPDTELELPKELLEDPDTSVSLVRLLIGPLETREPVTTG